MFRLNGKIAVITGDGSGIEKLLPYYLQKGVQRYTF